MAFDPKLERDQGKALLRSSRLLGLYSDLETMAAKMHGLMGTRKKDFTRAAELEYMGYMSLLASRDYSVLRELEKPHQDTGTDYPRRIHSRHRMSHLLGKIYDGTLILNGPSNLPTWSTDHGKLTVSKLTLARGANRRLVEDWVIVVSKKHLEDDEMNLANQMSLTTDMNDFKTRRAIGDDLVEAATDSGCKPTRRNITRKVKDYCKLVRVVQERQQVSSGFYWTLQEERAYAEFLVANKGQLDYTGLAAVVPTRTAAAIRERLQKRSEGIMSLIDEIETEAAARFTEENCNEDDNASSDWDE